MTSETKRRDILAFDRADRWGLAVLLLLIVTATTAELVVGPIVGWVRGEALSVPYFSDVQVPGLAGTGLVHTAADYALLVAHPTARMRWLDLLPGVGHAVLVAAMAWVVLRLMTDIGRGSAFARRNVTRLRVLAGLLLVGWTVVYFAAATCTFAILTELDLSAIDGGPRAALTLPVVPFVAGLIVALVAEAFRAGTKLQDDVEGLV